MDDLCDVMAITLLKDCEESSKEERICRIPEWVKRQNVEAYEPKMVSIGPLYHGITRLQTMEIRKKEYFKDFLRRTPVSVNDLLKFIMERKDIVRKCYADVVVSESFHKKFIKMILVDAAFVIEILLRYSYTDMRNEDDDSIISNIWGDFWLLENQLPFFIIEELFSIAKIHYPIYESRFIVNLAIEFVQLRVPVKKDNVWKIYNSKVKHFVDLLTMCYLPSKLPSKLTHENVKYSPTLMTSALELYQAGIKLKQAPSDDLFKIRFDRENGVLEIPHLSISFHSEIIFRNLLAYEQHKSTDNYVNDYLIMMDRLINKSEDVDLLVEKGIVDSSVGNSKEAAILINRLGKVVNFNPMRFFFEDVCHNVDDYNKRCLPQLMATLKQQYFYNPWTYISFSGGVLLLCLTIIQTIASIYEIIKD